MPLSISDLPRADGIVRGNFRARHRSKTFSLQGYGFHFVRGVTGTLRGRIADRLHAAYGQDVTFEPCDVDSALLALGWMRGRGQPEARVSRIEGLLEQLFMQEAEPPDGEGKDGGEGEPDATEGEEAQPQAPTGASQTDAPSADAAPAGEPARPTTPAELEALSDDALRALAADLGVTDKRWSVQRLRRFVADELGIGEQA